MNDRIQVFKHAAGMYVLVDLNGQWYLRMRRPSDRWSTWEIDERGKHAFHENDRAYRYSPNGVVYKTIVSEWSDWKASRDEPHDGTDDIHMICCASCHRITKNWTWVTSPGDHIKTAMCEECAK